jgi:hypothetical protein
VPIPLLRSACSWMDCLWRLNWQWHRSSFSHPKLCIRIYHPKSRVSASARPPARTIGSVSSERRTLTARLLGPYTQSPHSQPDPPRWQRGGPSLRYQEQSDARVRVYPPGLPKKLRWLKPLPPGPAGSRPPRRGALLPRSRRLSRAVVKMKHMPYRCHNGGLCPVLTGLEVMGPVRQGARERARHLLRTINTANWAN